MADLPLIIRSNVHSKENFDGRGQQFERGAPFFYLDSTIRVEWHLYENTPDAGSPSANPDRWTPASYPGCSALLTCDNDRLRRVSGTLNQKISAENTIDEISLQIKDPEEQDIQSNGFITLYNSRGEYETFTYTSFSITESVIIFQIASAATRFQHNIGETVTITQQVLFQQIPVPAESYPEKGIFVFDILVNSAKLQKKADQNRKGKIPGVWLELLPFRIDTENHYCQYQSFQLKCCSIVIPLGEPGAAAYSAGNLDMMLTAFVQQMLKYGFETEVRTNDDESSQFRFRSAAAGGEFCDWITIPRDKITVDFDEVYAVAAALPQESTPTVSVFAEEKDQKKILHFEFGIPVGKNGSSGKSFIVISDPSVEFTVADPVYGRIIALDNITPYITLMQPVWDLKNIRFRCISASENISGNIVLIPYLDNVDQSETLGRIIVAADGVTEYSFPVAVSGNLKFKRDTTSANDTLKDNSSVVAALIVNMELEVIH